MGWGGTLSWPSPDSPLMTIHQLRNSSYSSRPVSSRSISLNQAFTCSFEFCKQRRGPVWLSVLATDHLNRHPATEGRWAAGADLHLLQLLDAAKGSRELGPPRCE